MFDGFGKWVDALHHYRHGQASYEPVAPSEALAVYVINSGSGFVRLLSECYQRIAQPLASQDRFDCGTGH
jgi:hypothetical protein